MTLAPPVGRPAPDEAGIAGPPARTHVPWLLDRLRIDRADLWAMGALLLVAFVLRYFSPIMPDFLSGQGFISNCVRNTPVDASNDTGTLCGLSYPFQRNYAQVGQPPTPPNGQVFDEIYFGVFAHDDLKGIPYFDPEPPLSKLIIAAGEWLDGWWRATFQGAHGDYADLGFNTFGWRIMSCLVGSLTVPLMYLFARRLWPPRLFALAAATLTCFDGLFFVQSRIGMIDIFPIFLIVLAYTLFLVHLDSRSERDSLVTLLLTGIALGLAVAAKWIALAALASIALWLIVQPVMRALGFDVGKLLRRTDRGETDTPFLPGGASGGAYAAVAVVALAIIPVAIYLASWIPFFTRGQFHNLGDLVAYNEQAYIYHATLKATHPYGSAWYTWPFLIRPVAYYYEYQGLGVDATTNGPLVAGMIDLGNPVVWWLSIFAVLSLPYFVIRHRSFPAAVILVGFVTQYLPWSRISRVIFLYHMFGGLIFMVMALAFVLTQIQLGVQVRSVAGAAADRVGPRFPWVMAGVLAVVVVAFLYFYPVWTALPISESSYLSGFPWGKMWLRTWI